MCNARRHVSSSSSFPAFPYRLRTEETPSGWWVRVSEGDRDRFTSGPWKTEFEAVEKGRWFVRQDLQRAIAGSV